MYSPFQTAGASDMPKGKESLPAGQSRIILVGLQLRVNLNMEKESLDEPQTSVNLNAGKKRESLPTTSSPLCRRASTWITHGAPTASEAATSGEPA